MIKEFEKYKTNVPVKLEYKIANLPGQSVQVDGVYYDIPLGTLIDSFFKHSNKSRFSRSFDHDLITEKYIEILNELTIRFADQ